MQRKIVSDLVSNQHLATLSPGATVQAAAELMTERRIGAVLVVEHGRLVGIFSERDMVTRVVTCRRDPLTTVLAEVMTAGPITVASDTPVARALWLMSEGHFRHLPVVDGGHLVGILSLRDFSGADIDALKADIVRRNELAESLGWS